MGIPIHPDHNIIGAGPNNGPFFSSSEYIGSDSLNTIFGDAGAALENMGEAFGGDVRFSAIASSGNPSFSEVVSGLSYRAHVVDSYVGNMEGASWSGNVIQNHISYADETDANISYEDIKSKTDEINLIEAKWVQLSGYTHGVLPQSFGANEDTYYKQFVLLKALDMAVPSTTTYTLQQTMASGVIGVQYENISYQQASGTIGTRLWANEINLGFPQDTTPGLTGYTATNTDGISYNWPFSLADVSGSGPFILNGKYVSAATYNAFAAYARNSGGLTTRFINKLASGSLIADSWLQNGDRSQLSADRFYRILIPAALRNGNQLLEVELWGPGGGAGGGCTTYGRDGGEMGNFAGGASGGGGGGGGYIHFTVPIGVDDDFTFSLGHGVWDVNSSNYWTDEAWVNNNWLGGEAGITFQNQDLNQTANGTYPAGTYGGNGYAGSDTVFRKNGNVIATAHSGKPGGSGFVKKYIDNGYQATGAGGSRGAGGGVTPTSAITIIDYKVGGTGSSGNGVHGHTGALSSTGGFAGVTTSIISGVNGSAGRGGHSGWSGRVWLVGASGYGSYIDQNRIQSWMGRISFKVVYDWRNDGRWNGWQL